jgi:hypothetical protein
MWPELLGRNDVVVGDHVMVWLILFIVPGRVDGNVYLEAWAPARFSPEIVTVREPAAEEA